MISKNALKNYIIFDNNNKYDEINGRIIKVTNLYFKVMKNYSFQLTQIENKLNEYNIKNDIKIKQLLQNQHSIIKDLINIINKILSYKVQTETILTGNDIQIEKNSILRDNYMDAINNLKIDFPLKKTINKNYEINTEKEKIKKNYLKNTKINEIESNIIKNKNNRTSRTEIRNGNKKLSLNIPSLRSVNNLKNNSDLVNMKYLNINKNKKEKKLLNKQQIKNEIELSNKKLFKSMSISEISNKPKINNQTLYIKTSSFSNSNPSYFNGNYTIDEERNNTSLYYDQERQYSQYNRTYNDGSLPNLLSKPNKPKKIKYRTVESIPLKEEYYLINNYTFTNFNITNNSSYKSIDNSYNRKNNSLIFLNKNINNINTLFLNNHSIKRNRKKIYSAPYINNGIQIIPTRYTKEVLNSSYKILKKYKNKSVKKFN